MTDLRRDAVTQTNLYGQRITVEERAGNTAAGKSKAASGRPTSPAGCWAGSG